MRHRLHPRAPRRVQHALVLIAVVLAAGAVSVPPAGAQAEIPVGLRAKTFQYNRATRVLVATGDVVVTYQDIVISADRLRADLGTNDVRAEGRVRLEVGRQSIRGDSLDYNLVTRRGRVTRAAAAYSGPMVIGTVFIRAESMEGALDSFFSAHASSCTTCEGPNPVVRLTADELTVYLNDKIVGRRVAVWIAGRKVFTWPSFVIFIREQRASRLLPIVGFSEAEGYFLKTFYSYALNENHYGYLRLDLMDRLGVGYGVEHAYRLRQGSGVAFLYRLENKQTGGADSRLVLSHQQQLGDITARLFADYLTATAPGAPVELFGVLDAYHRGPRSSSTLYQSYSARDWPGFWARSYSGRAVHSLQLSDALSAELAADFSRAASNAGTDDEMYPRLVLRYRGSGYYASLVAEGRVDLDGDAFPGDIRYTTERLPELSVVVNPRLLDGTRLVYQLQAGLGRFRETLPSGTVDVVRTDAAVTVGGPLLVSDRGYLNLRAQARGSYYSSGDARAFISGRLDYTHQVNASLTGQLGFTYQDQAGQSPFAFDRISGRMAQADATLTYRQTGLVATATTSFDGITGRLAPIVAQVQYAPRPGWSAAAAAAYDPWMGGLSRAELAFDVTLNPNWQAAYFGFYDGTGGRFYHDRLTITRIWDDCLATAITYRGVAGEIWFETWLTALPWVRGRVGVSGQGTLLFDQPWLWPRQ